MQVVFKINDIHKLKQKMNRFNSVITEQFSNKFIQPFIIKGNYLIFSPIIHVSKPKNIIISPITDLIQDNIITPINIFNTDESLKNVDKNILLEIVSEVENTSSVIPIAVYEGDKLRTETSIITKLPTKMFRIPYSLDSVYEFQNGKLFVLNVIEFNTLGLEELIKILKAQENSLRTLLPFNPTVSDSSQLMWMTSKFYVMVKDNEAVFLDTPNDLLEYDDKDENHVAINFSKLWPGEPVIVTYNKDDIFIKSLTTDKQISLYSLFDGNVFENTLHDEITEFHKLAFMLLSVSIEECEVFKSLDKKFSSFKVSDLLESHITLPNTLTTELTFKGIPIISSVKTGRTVNLINYTLTLLFGLTLAHSKLYGNELQYPSQYIKIKKVSDSIVRVSVLNLSFSIEIKHGEDLFIYFQSSDSESMSAEFNLSDDILLISLEKYGE